jgi:RimJ/RimL family protein N-acetyltransferase
LAGFQVIINGRFWVFTEAVGAGHSEYQVWLASPNQSEQFIESALDHLATMFPRGQLMFLFAPQATPLAFGPRWKRRSEVRHFSRGLLSTVSDADIELSLKKKANRSKLNRLKRLGDLSFRRVSEPDEAKRVMEEMEAFYDTRQLAISGIAPFAEDPFKALFYKALIETEGLLHVTEMRLDGKLIAAHIGPINRGQVILGMIAHSPFYSEHSVGKLHLLMMSALLSHEGFRALDLTPGGEYKDRFATEEDEVYALTFFLGEMDRQVYACKRMVIGGLKRFVSTDRVKASLTILKQKRSLVPPAEIPGRLFRRAWKWISQDSEFRIYRLPVSEPVPPGKRMCRRDNLEDLLLYAPSESWQPSRSAFSRTALERLANRSHLYTRVIDGKLAHWGWLTEGQEKSVVAEVGQTVELPPNSVVLFDYYTRPEYRGRGLYSESLSQMVSDAREVSGAEWIVIGVLSTNFASRKIIERTRFEYWQSRFQKVRLGGVTRW